jgi:hypothetical protein
VSADPTDSTDSTVPTDSTDSTVPTDSTDSTVPTDSTGHPPEFAAPVAAVALVPPPADAPRATGEHATRPLSVPVTLGAFRNP